MSKVNFWESQSLEDLNVSISSRIALVLCHKPALSRVLLIFMFVIYQLEVFTMVMRPTAQSIKTESRSEIFNNIYDDALFGAFDTIADSSDRLLSILGCVLAYVILDILLVIYMAGAFYLGKKPHPSVEKICNSLAYIHNLILSFPIHVCCCQVLYVLSKGQEIGLLSERSVLSAKALCILIIVINAIWSLTKILLFDINIKTKDPISSKTSVLTLFEFVFRFGMSIFEAFALPNGTLIYALLSVNLVCSLLRDYLFFYYLPYYKLPVLKIATISHAVITSSAFAAIFSRPISKSRSYSELDFFLPLAVISILILGKLYTRYLNILTRTILQNPAGITNPYHLIHYLRVYKAYEKCSQPSVLTTKVKENYFIYTSIVKQSEVSHLLSDQQYGKIDHKAQEMIDQYFVKHFLSLLNAAIKKNPKLSILEVTLAHLYMKFEKLYVLADQIANKSAQHSFGVKNSTSLIRMTIWEKLRNECSSQNDGAVQKHIHLQEMYRNLKMNVIDQLKKGVQFWKNFQEPDTDFYSLMNLASQISKRSKYIKKSASYYDVFQEFNFSEPLLIYSLYFFFAQNDIMNAQKFFKEYSKSKFKKVSTTSKGLMMLNFTTEALYFTLSTSQENFGITLDCSGQVLKTLGLPKEMIIKRQLSTIMPQFYVKWFEDFLKTSVVNSNFEKGNKATEVPIMMKDGYIMPHLLQITLNYTRQFGLCFSGLLRPIKDHRRIVLIAKNGQILNVSQKFAEDINIEFHKDRNNKSIFNFCPSLEQIILNFTNENPYCARLSERVNIEENKDPVENLLEIADEENNDTQIKENISTKKVSLTFQPHLNTPSKLDLLSPSEIEYTTKIQLRTIQGISFFELSMEKTNFNMTQRLSFAKTSTVPTITKSLTIEIAKPAIQESSPKLEGLNPQSYLTLSPRRRRESKTTQNNEYFKLEALGSSVSVLTPKGANNMPPLETGTDNPNNYATLMSPASEDKRLLVSPKGDTDIGIDDDIISDKKRTHAHKDFGSISFEKEVEKHDDKLALDFMSISDEDSSSILSGTKRIDAYKVTRKTIESRAYQSSSHAYNICFIIAVLIQMTFLIWLNFFTSNVSNNVTALSQVIQNTYFRSFWLKIVDNDALVLSAIRGGWYDYDLESIEYGVLSDLDSAADFNQNLEQYLSTVDEDIQALFYQKNVRVKERDASGNLQLVSIDDTFEVTNKIISYGLPSVDKPDQNYSGMDFLDYNTAFIADNSLNDFMIVSENLTSFLETKLANLFSDSKRTILGSLCASIVVLVLFISVSVIFVMHLNKDASHFMELIFTLPADEVTSTEYYLSAFQDLLERDSDSTEILDYLHTLNFKIQRKATHREITAGNVKKIRKIVHRASMGKFHARNYWILTGLFICLGLTTALMVVYYDLASHKIAVMKQQHSGLNAALSFLNIMAYVNPQAQVLTLWNGTSTIENIPSLQFIKDINAKLSIVTQFESTLTDTNGDIPAVQQNILFNYSCTEAYSPYYSWPLELIEPECDSISNGLGEIGLISLVLQLQQRLDDIVTQFETNTRDEAFLENFYEYVFNTVYYTDTGFVLLLQSYAYSLETFGSLVTELEDERVVLSWVAVVLSIAIGAITWIFIIRRLVRKEFQKKRMLVLIPNKLIFGSYLLTKYVAELK